MISSAFEGQGARVLVVEDEPKIAALLRDYLQASGYRVRCHASGIGAVEAALSWPAELVLLDVQLPGRDGFSLCRELRERSAVPVLLLTARIEEVDRLQGFELGADDYVCKPFSPREVVVRVRALLRRAHSTSTSNASAELALDDSGHAARWRGLTLPLTVVEYRLLATLSRRPGTVLTRAQLIEAAYDDHRVVSERTIDSHLKNLRRKLDAAGADGERVEAVYGLGYRFRAGADSSSAAP
jgi:two-component system response regulator BaeR